MIILPAVLASEYWYQLPDLGDCAGIVAGNAGVLSS
jgi:hypothetical protein